MKPKASPSRARTKAYAYPVGAVLPSGGGKMVMNPMVESVRNHPTKTNPRLRDLCFFNKQGTGCGSRNKGVK